MSREVRRVPMDWQHPMEWKQQWDSSRSEMRPVLGPKPLFDRDILRYVEEAEDPFDMDSVMPEFAEGTANGWCMYETTSEGTPISPVMETPEALAVWLSSNQASAFGSSTATYEQWMRMISAGWAPSAVSTSTGLQSGVEFVAEGPQ